ncbi:MAG TPA: peptidoglycan-binding domain-containing protein [Candidatus Limnocylindrales bacterium]|nr:peptidoglycan-binding domain-containing protein [Candidatus Limnocylindrales bacterium]
MRQLLCRRNFTWLVLAALVASLWTLPAVATQNSGQGASKTTPKTSSAGSSHAASDSSTKKSTKKRRGKRVKGQSAPTPERISEIQDALARNGAFAGTPTGKWDGSTVAAMRKFQASKGLNPTGKLDALTLQKLGLGSETAGLAAPTPPPNSTNHLRNLASMPAESPDEPRE